MVVRTYHQVSYVLSSFVHFRLLVEDFGDDAREDEVDEASPPMALAVTLPIDFRLEDDDDDSGALLLFEGLGLPAPIDTAGTRSFAKSWAWRASVARRYLFFCVCVSAAAAFGSGGRDESISVGTTASNQALDKDGNS